MWNNTGNGPSSPLGTYTSRYKQSSSALDPAEPPPVKVPTVPPHPRHPWCGPLGSALTAAHPSTGCGGRKRLAPVGGAAYGTWKKVSTHSAPEQPTGRCTPWIGPLAVAWGSVRAKSRTHCGSSPINCPLRSHRSVVEPLYVGPRHRTWQVRFSSESTFSQSDMSQSSSAVGFFVSNPPDLTDTSRFQRPAAIVGLLTHVGME
mmetsp:Transcript_21282/g.54327  ORF Transcript_21282/g.54327 Transcript_21282/m.54327 type:complete len:203 (-) Transcript_21282:178-786(-)